VHSHPSDLRRPVAARLPLLTVTVCRSSLTGRRSSHRPTPPLCVARSPPSALPGRRPLRRPSAGPLRLLGRCSSLNDRRPLRPPGRRPSVLARPPPSVPIRRWPSVPIRRWPSALMVLSARSAAALCTRPAPILHYDLSSLVAFVLLRAPVPLMPTPLLGPRRAPSRA
jgi:hypothetical protein